ncbi:MAG: rhomboid family intramembrane serine protease [Alphaproteobacteria bacterium]|nr:rhomboid family intramembrane serine protease [Alphaproteobacteria bacterium]
MIPLHDDNPVRERAVVVYLVIGLCVGIFLWQLGLGERQGRAVVASLGMIPAELFGLKRPTGAFAIPEWSTILTSMFLHGGVLHLAGNMLFLWVFGNNVEDAMGHLRFVAFYLLCGAAAALAQALVDPGSPIPMIGASGAIAGVLGAYLLLYPQARVLTLIPFLLFYTVRLPAWVVLGLWFGAQIVNSLTADLSKGGVAWLAHVGGFVAGVLLIGLFKRRDVALLGGAADMQASYEALRARPRPPIVERAGPALTRVKLRDLPSTIRHPRAGSVPRAGSAPVRTRSPWR